MKAPKGERVERGLKRLNRKGGMSNELDSELRMLLDTKGGKVFFPPYTLIVQLKLYVVLRN